MTGSTQLLLVGVVVALTLLLLVVGFQVFLILKELQKSVQKVNKMLDDTGLLTESIAKPIASLANSITGVSGIAGLFGWLAKKRKAEPKKEVS